MKLLNKSLLYLSVSLLFIIGIWAIVFYFNMLDEIKESIDKGLDNYRCQVIHRAKTDSSVLMQNDYRKDFFAIREINKTQVQSVKGHYIDTMIYMQEIDDKEPELEPARMLTTAFENNKRYYELKVVNSMVEEDDLIENLFWQMVVLYAVLVACIFFINNTVLKRLWKPFYHFLNQLKNYRLDGSKNLPEMKTQTKEFIDLKLAVNALLQHNIETYEQQKQFIGNASHELQTPLAIAINKLELLIEKGNLQNEQAENISEIMQIVERLIRLNKSLLLLTKIENKQFLDNQPVSLNEIVKQSVNDLEEISEYKKVKISVTETAELDAKMDVSLANIIISNLLRNAVFHNTENGMVNVEISKNAVTFINSGKKEALNAKKIFTRFYKTENEQNGTGLGLAIVKAICDVYHFSITYHFNNNLHSFELRFN